MATRTRLRALALVALVAVVAAACGDDTSSDTQATSSSAPSDDGASAAEILGPDDPATGSPVRIGLINTEGGTALSLPEARETAEAAASYANDHLAGIDGHEIELVTCSEQGDAASATSCANQMVEDDVAAVVVTVSGQGDAIVPIVTGAGIPYFTVSGGSAAELTTPNVFTWSGGIVAVIGAWAQYAADNGIESVSAFTIDVPAATGAIGAIGTPAFEKAGVTLAMTAIPPGTADATSQVTAALGDDPDAVAVVGDATFCQSVLSALQTAAATQTRFLISPCVAESVVDALPGAVDGAVLFDSADIVSDDEEAQLFRAVMAEYSPDTDVAGVAVLGYQSLLGLVRAVNASGLEGADVTPESILAAVKAARDVVLPAGHGTTFTCDGSAIPAFTNICSAEVPVTTMEGDTRSTDYVIVDGAPLFAG